MQYFSTNQQSPSVKIEEAVLRGLAPDKGLYMPESIPTLPPTFFEALPDMPLAEIAFQVGKIFFGGSLSDEAIRQIAYDALDFPIPLVALTGKIHALELFHGPTCAFKDVGGRFMARLLSAFSKGNSQKTYVLTATSGDTGSAVASGFFQVPGIEVIILFPKGKVSAIQEIQLTTYGHNIQAVEVEGTFDDCQRLVKEAFVDPILQDAFTLTSANSINVARFLPQAFYYFHAWAQLPAQQRSNVVVAVPSGNFGNLTGGLFAHRMGLPIKRFIAATNLNKIVPDYLTSGSFNPAPSIQTLANAMDVGNPSNFARMLELFQHDVQAMAACIQGFWLDDAGILKTMQAIYQNHQYVADPHGAIGYAALQHLLKPDETGIFLETAHPAKFGDVVEKALAFSPELPERLAKLLQKEKKSINVKSDYPNFRAWMLDKMTA
jgi:threonine synthase